MVFGGRSSVLACSPTTEQAQRAARSGDLPKDASVGCEPTGLRDERQEEVREALPVSFSISEQQLDDLEDILSEPQPSTRARAPNPWDSHEEVLILGDRPWEELEKVQQRGRGAVESAVFLGWSAPLHFWDFRVPVSH